MFKTNGKNQLTLKLLLWQLMILEHKKRVKPLVNSKGWTYNVLMDVNQDFKRALSIVNIPYTIVVKNSLNVPIQNGFVPESDNKLLTNLKTL